MALKWNISFRLKILVKFLEGSLIIIASVRQGFEEFLYIRASKVVVKQHVFVSDKLHQTHGDNNRATLSTFPIVEQGFCDPIQRMVVQQVNLKLLP
jgi:hypothetical protein